MKFSPIEQVPVSIADLGGTEIDLRFANPKEGRISVVVAPVKRFSDGEHLMFFLPSILVLKLRELKEIRWT